MFYDTDFYPAYHRGSGYRRPTPAYRNPYTYGYEDDEDETAQFEYARRQELARRQQLARQQQMEEARQQEYHRQQLLRQKQLQQQQEALRERQMLEQQYREQLMKQRLQKEEASKMKQRQLMEKKRLQMEEAQKKMELELARKEEERQRHLAHINDPTVRNDSATLIQSLWRGYIERSHRVIQRLRSLRDERHRMESKLESDEHFTQTMTSTDPDQLDDDRLRQSFKRILSYEEALIRELLVLDGITVGRSMVSRSARKELVNEVNRRLSVVDGLKKKMSARYNKIDRELKEAAERRAAGLEEENKSEPTTIESEPSQLQAESEEEDVIDMPEASPVETEISHQEDTTSSAEELTPESSPVQDETSRIEEETSSAEEQVSPIDEDISRTEDEMSQDTPIIDEDSFVHITPDVFQQ